MFSEFSLLQKVEDVDLVSAACHRVPLLIKLVGAALSLGLADESNVLEQLNPADIDDCCATERYRSWRSEPARILMRTNCKAVIGRVRGEREVLCRWAGYMLNALPDDRVLDAIQFSIFPGEFDTSAATAVLGRLPGDCNTSILLRDLRMLGLLEAGLNRGAWRMRRAVRVAAVSLARQLQLPLVAAR